MLVLEVRIIFETGLCSLVLEDLVLPPLGSLLLPLLGRRGLFWEDLRPLSGGQCCTQEYFGVAKSSLQDCGL